VSLVNPDRSFLKAKEGLLCTGANWPQGFSCSVWSQWQNAWNACNDIHTMMSSILTSIIWLYCTWWQDVLFWG